MFDPLQVKILDAIVVAGGSVTVAQLDALYPKGEGRKIAELNRRGITQWVRPEGQPSGNAIGLQITDYGRETWAAHGPVHR